MVNPNINPPSPGELSASDEKLQALFNSLYRFLQQYGSRPKMERTAEFREKYRAIEILKYLENPKAMRDILESQGRFEDLLAFDEVLQYGVASDIEELVKTASDPLPDIFILDIDNEQLLLDSGFNTDIERVRMWLVDQPHATASIGDYNRHISVHFTHTPPGPGAQISHYLTFNNDIMSKNENDNYYERRYSIRPLQPMDLKNMLSTSKFISAFEEDKIKNYEADQIAKLISLYEAAASR